MSRLLHLKRIGKKSESQNKKKRDTLLVNPRRDWATILISIVTLNLVIMAMHAFIFFKITKGDLFKTDKPVATEVQTINRSGLTTAVEKFRNRESLLIETITTPVSTPSVR